jgi:two-component sensor histidine kinase
VAHRHDLSTAVSLSIAGTLAALAGTALLRRVGFDRAVERSRDVVYLIAVALATGCICPTFGTLTLALNGRVSWSALPMIWCPWSAADTVGILLVTPLLLTWTYRQQQRWDRAHMAAFAAFIATVLVVSKFAFANPSPALEPRYLLLSTAFPLLIWGALQFGTRESLLAAAIMSCAAAYSWTHDRAPYPLGVIDRPLLVIDIFVAEIVGTALLLGSITAQRRRAYAELEQRVSERTAELASRNEEKEVLLKEIHHRVKNNMQVICSLLNLEARRFDDLRLAHAFADSQSRVKSMALVHEHLYQSRNLDRISMRTYVRALVEGVTQTHSRGDNVRCQIEADDITLPIDTAVPCGLIINEMVTNVFKHAFPDGRPGRLSVTFSELASDRIELRVCDDGIGLPRTQPSDHPSSFGMSLVTMLGEQLNASLEVLPTPGTSFRLIFPRLPADRGAGGNDREAA